MRKQNYRQQKKAKEDARKVRQAKKQERRQVLPAKELEESGAQSAPGDVPATN